MTKRVAIVQSNYIPWKGYFDLIASVDTFVIYDEMQYTKRDWRNRNKIKTPKGLAWLSIPVEVKGKYFQKISEVKVSDLGWRQSHWGMIYQNYRKAPFFDDVQRWLKPLYFGMETIYLSEINKIFIRKVCNHLGIETQIVDSKDYELLGDRNARLAHICEQVNGTEYVSGPAAKEYMDQSEFEERGIEVSWANYENYSSYPQLWGDFEHSVTILDLLFNVGDNAAEHMKFVK